MSVVEAKNSSSENASRPQSEMKVVCTCYNVKCKIEIVPEEPLKQNFWAILMKQSHLDLITVFLAEVIGTGLLVFLGCMGCVDGFDHYKPSHLSICLGFGLAVMLILNIFGCVSGAHLNPAVTVAAYVYRLVDFKTGVVYSIGQLLGGYLGYGALRAITADKYIKSDKFCVSLPSVETVPAFFVEFIITMVLILVCGGVWDPRNSKHHDSVPLRFGLAVTCLALVGGPYSGGSMNPARSFGPALYTGQWESHWIYWVAPMSSAIITSIASRMIFYREAPKEIQQDEQVPLREVKNNY